MDSIMFWNAAALEANRVAHTTGADTGTLGPTLSSRAMAIVHLAMYDAYAAARGNPAGLPAYRPGLPAPPVGLAPAAATAGAAYTALSVLYPSQRSYFAQQVLEANLSGAGVEDGFNFGVAVANVILSDRAADPDAGAAGYALSSARLHHQYDPDNPGQGLHAPFYGKKSKCFAVTERHELDAPPKPPSAEYETALEEVRGMGIAPELMGTLPDDIRARTPEHTLIGLYWGYDGAAKLGTPPRLYNQIVRVIADAKGNSEDQNARLFALVNAAMGDAGILAWDQKYIHDFWRPVIGIREHDDSMGETTTGSNALDAGCDPGWLPLGAPKTNGNGAKNFTPPFPAYPSGHATFGAAAFQSVRRFYGITVDGPDTLCDGLTFISEEFNGVNVDTRGTVRPKHVRNFPGGLWRMIEENGRSRVFLGVHWVFDAFAVDGEGAMDLSRKVGGVSLGLKIANDIFDSGMAQSPVGPRP